MVKKSDFLIEDMSIRGNWVKCIYAGERKYTTLAASKWWEMIKRCTPDGSAQKYRPTYKGCDCSENFRDFQYFAEWCQNQVGYGEDEYQLDKDILGGDTKFYSEDTCVFIPPYLNNFLSSSPASRGAYVQGVSHVSKGHGLKAQIHTELGVTFLGYFKITQEKEAYETYKSAKESLVARVYLEIMDGKYIVDNRVKEFLRTFSMPCYEVVKEEHTLNLLKKKGN